MTTCATRCTTSTSSSRTAPRPTCAAGTGKDSVELPAVLVLRVGRRPERPVVVADRLEPQPPRLPEPARGLGAVQRLGVDPAVADRPRPTGRPASPGSSSSTSGCSRPRARSPVARRTAGTATTRRRRLALPTFYGMAYDVQPVYHDPPSNQWFGFQAWSVERVAEYYYATGDAKAKAMLDKWVGWAIANTTFTANGDFQHPGHHVLDRRAGNTWNPSNPQANTGLHVTVVDKSGTDVGVAAAYARAAHLLRRQVRQHLGQDHGQEAARRHLAAHRREGCRPAGDPRRLQPVRRRLVLQQPAGPVHPAGLQRHHAQR